MRSHGVAVAAAALMAIGGVAPAASQDASTEIQRGAAAAAGCGQASEPQPYDDCIAGLERADAVRHPAAEGFRAGLRFKAWDTADGKVNDPALLYGDDTGHVAANAWLAVATADRQAVLGHAQALGLSEAGLLAAIAADADAQKRWAGYAKAPAAR